MGSSFSSIPINLPWNGCWSSETWMASLLGGWNSWKFMILRTNPVLAWIKGMPMPFQEGHAVTASTVCRTKGKPCISWEFRKVQKTPHVAHFKTQASPWRGIIRPLFSPIQNLHPKADRSPAGVQGPRKSILLWVVRMICGLVSRSMRKKIIRWKDTPGFRSAKQIFVANFCYTTCACILRDHNIKLFCTLRRDLMPLGSFLVNL